MAFILALLGLFLLTCPLCWWGRGGLIPATMLALAILSPATRAQVSCHKLGSSTYCSDGTSYAPLGDSIHGSDGTSYHRLSDSIYGSDGTSYHHLGDSMYGSDGTSYHRLGDSTYGPDGKAGVFTRDLQ